MPTNESVETLTQQAGYVFSWVELMPLLPELYLCLAAFALLMLGAFCYPRMNAGLHISTLLVLAIGFYFVAEIPPGSFQIMNGMLVVDGFTQFVKVLILLGAFSVLLVSGQWMTAGKGRPFEYLVLMLFAVIGMMLMVSSQSLLTLYMSLELSSLSLYVMASFQRDDARSSEAGLKYFVLGALASGMMLYGMSLLYGFMGTISFGGLIEGFSLYAGEAGAGENMPKGALVGLVMVIIGLAFKISAVPFHMWTPDVYQGAPTPVTAFFAVAPKIAALAAFARILMLPFGDLLPYWQPILIMMAAVTMLVGAFAALRQHNIKRLLAYSSIGHVGFMLIGLAAGTIDGVQAMLVYLSVYIFMSVGAFGCLLLMEKEGTGHIDHIEALAGSARTHPRISLALAIFMFSMAGIPPLAGFFGKLYVVMAAMQVGLISLVVIALLTTVVSCFYYLRIIKLMYFEKSHHEMPFAKHWPTSFGIYASAFITAFFFIIPGPVIDYAALAAQALLQ